jgi:hypothetical protein
MPDVDPTTRAVVIEALAELVDSPSEWADLFSIQGLLNDALEAYPSGATVRQIQAYIRAKWSTPKWSLDISARGLTANLCMLRRRYPERFRRQGRLWSLARS